MNASKTRELEKIFKLWTNRKYLPPLKFSEDNRRKLTEEDIIEINRLFNKKVDIAKLSDIYNVEVNTIKYWVDETFRNHVNSRNREAKYYKKMDKKVRAEQSMKSARLHRNRVLLSMKLSPVQKRLKKEWKIKNPDKVKDILKRWYNKKMKELGGTK